MNEPILQRKLVFKDDEVEVKEEDPIIPNPITIEDIHLVNPSPYWNHPSISFWKEKVCACRVAVMIVDWREGGRIVLAYAPKE